MWSFISILSVDRYAFIGERIQELYKDGKSSIAYFIPEGAIWKYFLNDSNNAADFLFIIYMLFQIKIEKFYLLMAWVIGLNILKIIDLLAGNWKTATESLR